jgi:hypothetical protein
MNSKSNCCVEIENNELLWEYIKCQDFMPIFFLKIKHHKKIKLNHFTSQLNNFEPPSHALLNYKAKED